MNNIEADSDTLSRNLDEFDTIKPVDCNQDTL